MHKSQLHQSSIAEQEHFNITSVRKKQQPKNQQKFKYASVNQIRSFQRSSQLYNQKLSENRSLLFSEQSLANTVPISFVSSAREQGFTLGGKKQETQDILEVDQDKLTLKLAVSNIRHENRLIFVIKNLKKKAVIELKAMLTNNEQNAVKFKYTMNLNDTNLLLRFKVWKEVEIPLKENKFTFEINQYNNQQTDIKINQFLFHLILKMPYYQKINYCLLHKGNAQVEKVEFTSRPEKKQVQLKENYCSNQCQII